MTTLHDLKRRLQDLSKEELINEMIAIRKSRRMPPIELRPRRKSKAEKKLSEMDASTLGAMVSLLKGEDNGDA